MAKFLSSTKELAAVGMCRGKKTRLKCVHFVEFIQYFVVRKPLENKTYAEALRFNKAS